MQYGGSANAEMGKENFSLVRIVNNFILDSADFYIRNADAGKLLYPQVFHGNRYQRRSRRGDVVSDFFQPRKTVSRGSGFRVRASTGSEYNRSSANFFFIMQYYAC